MSAVWTEAELKAFDDMVGRRVSISRIAVRLGRTRRAVVAQMRRRGERRAA